MWESIQSGTAWAGVGAAWLVTACLLLAGLVGCVLPVLPGHLILLLAAVAHRLMLGADGSGLEWWSFLVLGLLMVISQTFEMVSGAVGARWFGGSRWGALGALLGGVAGLLFLPFGLLLGPLVGAFVFELGFAKRHTRPAMVSGVGSVMGTLTGMLFNIVIGTLMVLWFFLDVFVIG
jgi:uncharacterized protein YqgC (DUF456 family)